MKEIVMRLKSGREFRFKCEEYTIKTFKPTGTLSEFNYKGGVGECPIYFQIEDIECIAIIGKEQIEELEQVPSEDCISREEVLNLYKEWQSRLATNVYEFGLELKKLLSVMPTERTGEWIPVSERPPEQQEKTYWICTDHGYQCECRWTNVNHIWTELTTDWHWHFADVPQYEKVVAWMPLLEPYKESDEE